MYAIVLFIFIFLSLLSFAFIHHYVDDEYVVVCEHKILSTAEFVMFCNFDYTLINGKDC